MPETTSDAPDKVPVTNALSVDEADLIIETRGLVKRYGKLTAINDLSLSVPRGAIYGFVGPNGAGKTSTMRILTTLMLPTAGQAYVAGYEVTKNPRSVRRVIGYMPDYFGVYDDMKVWEYLDFFAACYEIPEGQRPQMINDLLELVDLKHRRDDMVDKLSRGMKQRLCLARTLVHDPQVLILDEPASGLDPRARVEIRELMVELARMGKTIFFSSHILADVAEICTHIGIIEAGQMVMQGSMESIRRQLSPHREAIVTLLDRAEDARSVLSGVQGVLAVAELPDEGGRKRLRVTFDGEDALLSAMVQALAAQGIPVLNFTEQAQDLESVFMKVTKGIVS
ncbi:MAG: multidrug ABC transporter ATP-binding protein [Candidatus Thermofonsia Clade 1 bacterium]|uniref:Multidrug ABC transporter ATP-binding protein n=1 Tax=Candidatus Thermofonsia Clade 1 bacterium TaxID=2364210 RepID=A0A2M8PC46_9CHLR|nr:MAG: multidrug ABC transporter ATP-binding protein [Candidatus Thermofonsia Clade 1 bacterium]